MKVKKKKPFFQSNGLASQLYQSAIMGLFDTLAAMLKMKKEQINILVVGLNNSGKSTIVNHFKGPEEKSSVTVPTVVFSVEKFQSKSI